MFALVLHPEPFGGRGVKVAAPGDVRVALAHRALYAALVAPGAPRMAASHRSAAPRWRVCESQDNHHRDGPVGLAMCIPHGDAARSADDSYTEVR